MRRHLLLRCQRLLQRARVVAAAAAVRVLAGRVRPRAPWWEQCPRGSSKRDFNRLLKIHLRVPAR
jgi:hypothetical protein